MNTGVSMGKKGAIKIVVLILLLTYLLFFLGVAPKQIAKLGAKQYVEHHYQGKNLEFVNVEWVPQLNMYMVSFHGDNEQYNFIMEGKNIPYRVWYDPLLQKS